MPASPETFTAPRATRPAAPALVKGITTVLNPGYIADIGWFRWLWRYPLWQVQKRFGTAPIRVRLPHGTIISVPRQSPFSAALFLPRGFVDWGSELALVRMMRPGQVLLDVGSHFGYYSLIAAAEGMRCVAFEPDPRNETFFREATSGVAGIDLRRVAVADAAGRATFVQSASSACSHLADARVDGGAGVTVDVTTVDEVVFGEGLVVGGIKIDVEGFDRQVLHGARRTMREKRPVVCSESVYDEKLVAWAAEIDYRIGAFRQTADRTYGFAFGPPDGRTVCPMLFLVPAERETEMLAVTTKIAREHAN